MMLLLIGILSKYLFSKMLTRWCTFSLFTLFKYEGLFTKTNLYTDDKTIRTIARLHITYGVNGHSLQSRVYINHILIRCLTNN